MAARKTPQPPRTAGNAWGPQRVALGLSLRSLEKLSGVSRATLSMAEAGRLIPSGTEYQAVMAALETYRSEQAS